MAIPKEKFEQFERGEIQLEAFSAEERTELETIMAAGVPDDEAPVDETVKEVAPVVPPTPQDGTKEEVPAKGVVPGDKYKEKADEANTYRQRADTYARQLEQTRLELEALKKQAETKVENPVQNPENVWSDKHQLDLATEVARLKSIVETGVRGSETKLRALEKELADNKMYAEVNAFAFEFPELRLSRPFEEANREYIEFTKKLGATPTDLSVVDKYFSDATFRAEQEAKGIKPPKDYDRLVPILETFHAKKTGGYPDYRSAYLANVLSPQELEKRLSGRYLDGVKDAVDKISGNRQETTILDGTKSSDGTLKMTEAQMDAWIRTHPTPVTAQDKATMAQIQMYLEAQARG